MKLRKRNSLTQKKLSPKKFKLKRKVATTSTDTATKNVKLAPGDTPLKELHEFHGALYRMRTDGNNFNDTSYRNYIRQRHEDVFGEYPPADVATAYIKLKVAYGLMDRGYTRTGIPMPPVIRERYNAAMNYEVDRLPNSLASLLKIQAKHENNRKEDTMKLKKTANEKKEASSKNKSEAKAKVAKVAKDKTSKTKATATKTVSVAEHWQELMQANYKAKLSDEKLAAAMTKQFPDSAKAKSGGYTVADVRKHRSIWNNGRFPQQGGKKPKTALDDFSKSK